MSVINLGDIGVEVTKSNELMLEVWSVDIVFDEDYFKPVCDSLEYYDPANVYRRLSDDTYWFITVAIDSRNQMYFTNIDQVKPVEKMVTVYVPVDE